jgi:hypothetical protein
VESLKLADPKRILARVPSLETRSGLVIAIIAILLFLFAAIRMGLPLSDIANLASVLIPLGSLIAIVVVHNELMAEQIKLRRLQSRPQVIAYFERRDRFAFDDDVLVIVVKHFGGGPALDVRFDFSPPLRNHEGETFEDAIPLSTGIAVMPPGDERVVKFADYGKFQSHAGFHRVFRDYTEAEAIVPLSFEATIKLRDPLNDGVEHVTTYRMDLSHLMPYTMVD